MWQALIVHIYTHTHRRNLKFLLTQNIPELPHFNVLKLFQDKANKHLKHKFLNEPYYKIWSWRWPKKKKVHVFVLPGLSLAGSSWLWAAQAERAGPVLVFAAPQMCWWYTASKLWSPTAQTVECGYEWHSEKTEDATLKTASRRHKRLLAHNISMEQQQDNESVPCLLCGALHLWCWISVDWMLFALHQTILN